MEKQQDIALWAENFEPCRFENLKSSTKVATITNIPVKIDKILYDITGETVIGLTGTIVIRGNKVRGVWDATGNILHFRKLSILHDWVQSFDKIFNNCTEDMFSIVIQKNVENENV